MIRLVLILIAVVFAPACKDDRHRASKGLPVAVATQPTTGDKPPVDKVTAAKNAQDNMDILNEVTGVDANRKTAFGDADLAALKSAFEAFAKAPSQATYAPYEEVLRNNYVIDSVMAKHLAFYLSYADEIIRDLQAHPELAGSPARTQFDYLAEDLVDIGAGRPMGVSGVKNPAATAKGEALTAALKTAAGAPRK